jgi:hypothetical protein
MQRARDDAYVRGNASRENAAANAVAHHLSKVMDVPFAAGRWDDGSASGMHDFYIGGPGHKIALEVSTIANSRRVGRDFRWSREMPEGWLSVPDLQGCWFALHQGGAEARDVREAVESSLARLESFGFTRVDTRQWQQHAFEPDEIRPAGFQEMRALHAVGITQASRISDASDALLEAHAGEAHIARAFGSDRPMDRNFPVTVVNQELRDPNLHESDVRKLAGVVDASARHLWLWVEIVEGLGMIRSFETEGLPDESPDVDGLDGIWLGRSPSDDIVAGQAWIRGSGWTAFTASRDEQVPDWRSLYPD